MMVKPAKLPQQNRIGSSLSQSNLRSNLHSYNHYTSSNHANGSISQSSIRQANLPQAQTARLHDISGLQNPAIIMPQSLRNVKGNPFNQAVPTSANFEINYHLERSQSIQDVNNLVQSQLAANRPSTSSRLNTSSQPSDLATTPEATAAGQAPSQPNQASNAIINKHR